MKRSTNFSYTRKPRNPLKDIAMFLQDIGIPNEDIIKTLFPVKTTESVKVPEELKEEKES